jgi:aspartyl protease family protein
MLPVVGNAIDRVALHALFKNKAIVVIDGTRRVLALGEPSPEGVTLIEVDTGEETALLEFNGKRETVKLGVVISGFTQADRGQVILYSEPNGHFFADGLIDGVPIRFLVDTGATMIAFNSRVARSLNMDYKKIGQASVVQTAAGLVPMYNVKIKTVQIGSITMYNVDAGVIEGAFPSEPLLGMSFLNRLDMKRNGDRLELTQRY